MMRIKKYIYYGIKRSNPNKILFIDVNLVVDNYNTVLCSLLDSHAPLKTDYVTSRILQPWMSEEILSVKREKRKSERIWRKQN